MNRNDSIYEILLKYNFDLFRGNQGMTEYLSEHLDNYYSDIEKAILKNNDFLGEIFIDLLKAEMYTLSEICKKIKNILNYFDDGYITKVYEESMLLFDSVKPYLISRYALNNNEYYRIRSGDYRINNQSESKKQKLELFHIKKGLRNRIGAYRYSVSGYPCLYLSSSIELAWYECGMPKQFSYCRMNITETEDDTLKLVDFSLRPIEFLSSLRVTIINAKNKMLGENEIVELYNYLVKYIIMYPLVAACSVKVKDRSNKFVEEYVLSQLFMQWIRENDDFDGICYKSSLNSTLVQGMGAVNIALPVKQFREDGLDVNLTKKIGVSDIGYLDVREEFSRLNNCIDELKAFKNELRLYTIETHFYGDYVISLIELCDCIIKTYISLMEGTYSNSELIFTYVNNLFDTMVLLKNTYHIIIDKCNEKEEKNGIIIDRIIAEKHFNKFFQISNKILLKHSPFHFSFESLENFEYL